MYDSPKKWRAWLPLAEIWYNTSYHSSLGCSPFKALYGYEPKFPALPLLPSADPSSTDAMIHERDTHVQLLKQKLVAAQARIKSQADKKRLDRQFQVGELALLKLQPYTQSSLVNRPYPKLSFKYFGPYNVLQKIGHGAYKLELPEGSLVHPVFHGSELKPFTPDYTPTYSDIGKLVDLSKMEIFPKAIL